MKNETMKYKQKLFYLRPAKSCPVTIGFNEVYLYSSLVSRMSVVQGNLSRSALSKRQLAFRTGLGRGLTVAKALQTLQKHDLVKKEGNLLKLCS
jgi:hypothetical protein